MGGAILSNPVVIYIDDEKNHMTLGTALIDGVIGFVIGGIIDLTQD